VAWEKGKWKIEKADHSPRSAPAKMRRERKSAGLLSGWHGVFFCTATERRGPLLSVYYFCSFKMIRAFFAGCDGVPQIPVADRLFL
jgi:hypothetical protein